MSTLVGTTVFTAVKQTGVTTFTVLLTGDGVHGTPRPAGAGNTLVMKGVGGAIVTARISSSTGTPFTQRAQAASTLAVNGQDYVCVGGETQVFVSLNGADNITVTIEEHAGLGSFVAASTGVAVSPSAANNWWSSPTSDVTVTGKAMLTGAFIVTNSATTAPFNLANRWRQLGPLGAINASFANQPGTGSQYIGCSTIADIDATHQFPPNLAAGHYRMTSVWNQNTANTWCIQMAYQDTSGVPTVALPASAVARENSLPGDDRANWWPGTNGGTNSTIAGYCDKRSYQPGDTVGFQVDSSGFTFQVEVRRRGWYGWDAAGARSMLGNQTGYITGTVVTQPAPTVDPVLGSTSCAWTTNATWTVPSDACSGVYQATFRRTDAGNTGNFAVALFTVRPTNVTGKVVVVVPDWTYAAYNVWGATSNSGTLSSGTWTGRSLYQIGTDGAVPNFAHRAYATSFNRPMSIQATQANTWFDDSEYGVVQFLEGQGYDLAYLGTGDLDANPGILTTAAMVILNGHHEYWTTNAYNAVQNAVDAGVNLHFASSNTALWHTMFAAGDTQKRTMICYKDSGTVDESPGWSGTGLNPNGYTGTWRDSRTTVPPFNTDVRREAAIQGQTFESSTPSTVQSLVPFANKTAPIWRNSPTIQALTSGNTYTYPYANVGDEVDLPNMGDPAQPANMVTLNATPSTWPNGANAAGSVYQTPVSGTAAFTLYRRYSGALVFDTGSWRGWWGVSRYAKGSYQAPVTTPSLDWQNALLAVMYDLGAHPTAVTAMRPGVDTTPTDPATNAPTGGRTGVARAYGLRAPEDGAFLIVAG